MEKFPRSCRPGKALLLQILQIISLLFMENTNDRKLSFPQRNWFLICVLTAILSPLLVHLIQAGARKQAYKQSVDIRYSDTSNKIASPPGNDTGQKSKASTTDSAK
jgi:hypothetical protein